MNKAIAAALIVLGLLGLAWGGFTYTTRETIVDIGPIHATTERTRNVRIPPIAGTLSLVAGVVLLAVGRRKA